MTVFDSRTSLETLPKEKTGGLPVLATALRCVPYVIPLHWEGVKLAEELPGKAHTQRMIILSRASALISTW